MQIDRHPRTRIGGRLPRAAAFAATLAFAFAASRALQGADPSAEYYERLASVPVRSAEAFVDLGTWCLSAGLQEKATECFQRAIAIDSDCEKARLALGYRKYGTGWLKQGESPRGRARPPSPSPATPPPPDPPALKVAASTGGEGAPAISGPANTPEGKPGAGPGPQGTGSEGLEVEAKVKKPREAAAAKASSAEIEKKKAFAQAAAEKTGVTFSTYEDGDFLVHSTLSTSSREMKTLLGNLKGLKRVLAQMVGSGSGTKIWPDKLQFFLLKSEPEFERFAEAVDGLKSARNPDGAYTQGDHTVVFDPDTEILPRVLGETSLDKLGGSSRYVGWWLKEGIGELLHAQSAAGQKKLHYPHAMRHAAEIIQSDGQSLKIFNLIEISDYKPKDKDRNRALALSLLDYLFKKSRGGVRELIAELKSDKAPVPPATEEEFKAFFNLSYRSFQEEALKSAFHSAVDSLGEQWKSYVLAVVQKLDSDDAAKSAEAAKKKAGGGRKDKRNR